MIVFICDIRINFNSSKWLVYFLNISSLASDKGRCVCSLLVVVLVVGNSVVILVLSPSSSCKFLIVLHSVSNSCCLVETSVETDVTMRSSSASLSV